MNELLHKTLSEIVTDNYQAARVFENYGLDFCCKGKRPLEEACKEKGITISDIARDLSEAIAADSSSRDFNNMSLTELYEYIVAVHHSYCKVNMPQIFNYVSRVTNKHGDRFPYMQQVYFLFGQLQQEMDQHMYKEERILFPRIKDAEENNGTAPLDYLQAPVSYMEHEHEHAGAVMEQIRILTNNYTPPQQACTTFRLALESLKAFEEDVHQHVHLENNILFPKAVNLLTKQMVSA
jgi:regulator of cell morphogenesis and NO signaling